MSENQQSKEDSETIFCWQNLKLSPKIFWIAMIVAIGGVWIRFDNTLYAFTLGPLVAVGGWILYLWYFLPMILSHRRNHPKKYQRVVTIINFFLGWTTVGWIVALFLAFAPKIKEDKNEEMGI